MLRYLENGNDLETSIDIRPLSLEELENVDGGFGWSTAHKSPERSRTMGNKIRELTMSELNGVSGGDDDSNVSYPKKEVGLLDINNPLCTEVPKSNVSANYFHFAGAVRHRKCK